MFMDYYTEQEGQGLDGFNVHGLLYRIGEIGFRRVQCSWIIIQNRRDRVYIRGTNVRALSKDGQKTMKISFRHDLKNSFRSNWKRCVTSSFTKGVHLYTKCTVKKNNYDMFKYSRALELLHNVDLGYIDVFTMPFFLNGHGIWSQYNVGFCFVLNVILVHGKAGNVMFK